MKKVFKVAAFLLLVAMGFEALPGSLMGANASAAVPTSSWGQIIDQGHIRYYDTDGMEVNTSPQLGKNAVVSVEKSIEGTEIENEFLVTLDVKTSVDISNVKISSDAAVVLTLDVSASMQGSNLEALKLSVNNFLDSYVSETGDAKRYAALVAFDTNAKIYMSWTDVKDPVKLAEMKAKVNGLQAQNLTNAEGGLQLARNLLRKEALLNETGDALIENRSVILFSDGMTNVWASAVNGGTDHQSTQADYKANTMVYGGELDTLSNWITAQNYAQTMADSVKREGIFITGNKAYDKYGAYLYTIGYSTGAPMLWLRNSIATNSSYFYSAENASDLNDVFAAISKRIENWAKAWVVTDPMGTNIEFIESISQGDSDTGHVKFEDNTLKWNLKEAVPKSFINDIYTYSYTYRIRLDTTLDTFKAETPYLANGETKLTYVMVTDGKVSSDILTADFAIPSVKGHAGRLSFTKVGNYTARLADCVFLLENKSDGKAANKYQGVSAQGTGSVNFANIPSGHTYKLSEVSMPEALKAFYSLNDETLTVKVAYGEVTISNSKGTVLANGFQFNNPSQKRTVTGLVYPIITDDLGLGSDFLRKHDAVVELRTTFMTPAPLALTTRAVSTGTGDSGRFTIENVEFGDYILYIKRPGYLTRCLPITISETSPAVIELSPPGSETMFNLWWGDVNDDLVIDNLDIMVILESMSLEIDAFSPLYNPAHDLNGDGLIDNLDIMMILENLGKDLLQYPGAETIDPWS